VSIDGTDSKNEQQQWEGHGRNRIQPDYLRRAINGDCFRSGDPPRLQDQTPVLEVSHTEKRPE
jgi:hypothetical protein